MFEGLEGEVGLLRVYVLEIVPLVVPRADGWLGVSTAGPFTWARELREARRGGAWAVFVAVGGAEFGGVGVSRFEVDAWAVFFAVAGEGFGGAGVSRFEVDAWVAARVSWETWGEVG